MTARSRGFTLAEIAVAVAVLALLLGGLLIPLSTQLEGARQREAQRALELIREALVGYALANGRLPCPAAPNVPAGVLDGNGINGGAEQRNAAAPGACTNTVLSTAPPISPIDPQRASGVVPFVTLGVPELDPWGQRFSYVVDHALADSASIALLVGVDEDCFNPSAANIRSFCAPSNQPGARLEIRTRTAGGPEVQVAREMVAVVISHGRNGYYGWRANGALPTPNPVANARDELINAVSLGGAVFTSIGKFLIDRPQVRDASPGCDDVTAGASLCEFDDLVIGLSRSLLVGRMASAGRL